MGKTVTLAGPKAYTVEEVIELCEKYAGADADVTQVPVWLLRATRNALRGFQWARDAADRLVCPSPLRTTWLSPFSSSILRTSARVLVMSGFDWISSANRRTHVNNPSKPLPT